MPEVKLMPNYRQLPRPDRNIQQFQYKDSNIWLFQDFVDLIYGYKHPVYNI